MGLAVIVACGSVHFAQWCFLVVSFVVLVAQMARMTRRGRGRVRGRFRGRVQGSRTPALPQGRIANSSSRSSPVILTSRSLCSLIYYSRS
jgi:hypothetical protein